MHPLISDARLEEIVNNQSAHFAAKTGLDINLVRGWGWDGASDALRRFKGALATASGGRLSAAQVAVHNDLRLGGWKVIVVTTFDYFTSALDSYLQSN